jgi:hypothetical protein
MYVSKLHFGLKLGKSSQKAKSCFLHCTYTGSGVEKSEQTASGRKYVCFGGKGACLMMSSPTSWLGRRVDIFLIAFQRPAGARVILS